MKGGIIVSVHKRLNQFNAALTLELRVVRYALLLFAIFCLTPFLDSFLKRYNAL